MARTPASLELVVGYTLVKRSTSRLLQDCRRMLPPPDPPSVHRLIPSGTRRLLRPTFLCPPPLPPLIAQHHPYPHLHSTSPLIPRRVKPRGGIVPVGFAKRTSTGAGWNPTPQLRNRASPEDCRRLTSLPTTAGVTRRRIPGDARPIARPPSNGSRLTLHPSAPFRFNPKKDLLVRGAGPDLRRDPWRGIGNAASAGSVQSPRARAPTTPWQWSSFPHTRSARSRRTC